MEEVAHTQTQRIVVEALALEAVTAIRMLGQTALNNSEDMGLSPPLSFFTYYILVILLK